jgi:hypothetical protein
MSTAALVYLAAGLVLRGQSMAASWGHFMSLGTVLALAYFSKAALFPVAFVFLAVSACAGESLRHALPRALVALLVFATVSAPWILALSTAKGHFTFSDAGKLSYVWLVNPGAWLITDHHWQGEHAGYGTPTHPTHKIFDAPPAFEFGAPLGGTYPPWYDPSYWYDGLLLQFALPQQLKIVAKNLLFYYRTCLQSVMFGYLLLLGTGGVWRPSLRGLRDTWPLFLLAGAGLGVYGLGTDLSLAFIEDQPSTRYIAPFLVLLFAGVFASVRLPDTRVSQHVLVGFTIAVVGVTGTTLALHAAKDVTRLLHTKHTHWEIAEGLHSLGVPPGSKVAHLGMKNYYWARVARVKIVAEIPNPEEFWAKSAAVRADVLQAIK